MARVSKHAREIRKIAHELGAANVGFVNGRHHARIVGVTADGRRFELPFATSPSDCNWLHAARRQLQRIIQPEGGAR